MDWSVFPGRSPNDTPYLESFRFAHFLSWTYKS
jgi:hypothetical protein